MAYKSDILLGRITKVSGYEGAVAVKLEKIFTENIPQMESVFLEIEGGPVPFFISDIEYSGADILKMQFEGYTSNEKISEFIDCKVFLTSEANINIRNADNPDLIGYNVIVDENKPLGLISDVMSNSGQWLITVISSNKRSILIPFHEDFIVRIDKKGKRIFMDIPDGLIEIN
ncbi:MAG TPA: ribosome maturation factor RimM [Bacteroidales bacterium]|nr:ribosome maturation factor RimM [Bacteroidales bacterium]